MKEENCLQKRIVRYCSPTLANMKAGSLFTCSAEDTSALGREIAEINRQLKGKDVFVRLLNISDSRALVYVYRRSMLADDLKQKEVSSFLEKAGYNSEDPDDVIRSLRKRISSGGMPHEIGLFLGYPFQDVSGFIENEGRNYLYLGCWKVYCDECRAREKFCQFRECKCRCMKMLNQGCSFSDLIA